MEPSAFVAELEYHSCCGFGLSFRNASALDFNVLLLWPDTRHLNIVPLRAKLPCIIVGSTPRKDVVVLFMSQSHMDADIVTNGNLPGIIARSKLILFPAIINSVQNDLPACSSECALSTQKIEMSPRRARVEKTLMNQGDSCDRGLGETKRIIVTYCASSTVKECRRLRMRQRSCVH